MSKLPHFLENRLTDGGEVVSLTHFPPRPLLPGRFLVLFSVKRLSRTQGYSAAGRIRSIEKSYDLIKNQTRDLPDRSIVPQPTMLLFVSLKFLIRFNVVKVIILKISIFWDITPCIPLKIS
jgi:hypothetical protein